MINGTIQKSTDNCRFHVRRGHNEFALSETFELLLMLLQSCKCVELEISRVH